MQLFINQVTVCLFSEGETMQRQITIEDVEEDLSDSDFWPNMVRKLS